MASQRTSFQKNLNNSRRRHFKTRSLISRNMQLEGFYYFLLIFISYQVKAENVKSFSSSISQMGALLKMERTLIENMNQYIAEMNTTLIYIKAALNSTKFINGQGNCLENPFQSVALKRKLALKWSYLLNYVEEPIGKAFLDAIDEILISKPDLDEVRNAAEALERIQIVYDLHIDKMAKGWLYKRKYKSSLTALDANTIGKLLFQSRSRENAKNWLEFTLRLNFDKELYSRVFRKGIKKFYNDYKTAARLVDGTYKNLSDIQAISRGTYKELNITAPDHPAVEALNLDLGMIGKFEPMLKVYKRICQGKPLMLKFKNLICYYNRNSFYLRLAPTKVEILSYDPPVFLLLDVISNADIDVLKKVGSDHMKPTAIFKAHIKKPLYSTSSRNAQTSYFFEHCPAVNGVQQDDWMKRLESTIGIHCYEHQEDANIVNYGIGGHYSLHYDVLPEQYIRYGNRLASLTFYLSDVEQGGATVFPILDLAVFPRKGAALLWFNLYKNGKVDERTMHSSCPVVKGSKWIMAAWFHDRLIEHNSYYDFLL